MSKDESLSQLEPNLYIELINSELIYELYDYINGILTLELNQTLHSKCIKIKLKCIGEVKWIKLNGTISDSQIDRSLKQREIFLNTNYNIEKNYKAILEPGLHKIPFSFQLIDKKLPPTFFEDSNGLINSQIFYYITASIVDQVNNQLIIKTPRVYLKKVQIGLIRNDLLLPIGRNAFREFRNFCFQRKAKVQVYVYISKKGYVTGENVPIELQIINNSTHKVYSNISLHQTKCFSVCKNKQHIIEHHFETITGSTVLKDQSIKETINLRIPEDCIISFKTPIIMVSYFIHLTLNITKQLITKDLQLNIPITITTNKSLLNC